MAKISDFSLDLQAVEEGKEFEYAEGWVWTIRRMSCAPMRRRLERDQGLRGLQNKRSAAAQKEATKRFKKAVAECLVVGWKGLDKDDGSEDAFSVKRCMDIFENPETEHIFVWVCECANGEDDYLQELQEEALGNSLTS